MGVAVNPMVLFVSINVLRDFFLTWEDEANIGAICQRTKSTSMQVDCLN